MREIALTMNPKKPQSEKSKSAGISLPPDLAQRARVLSAQRGFSGLSGLVRNLLAKELEQSGRADLRVAEDGPKYATRGVAKIAKAAGKKKKAKGE